MAGTNDMNRDIAFVRAILRQSKQGMAGMEAFERILDHIPDVTKMVGSKMNEGI